MGAIDLPHSDNGPRDGPAVILLHGFPLDHRMWRAQKDALVAAGARVLVPDLRGFGKAPLRQPSGMREHAEDVLRLAERAGVRRFVLGGFSMGGYVAFEVARLAPERVAALLLIDTRAEPDDEAARAGRAATAQKVRAEGLAPLADAMLPKLLTPAAPPELVASVRDIILQQPPEGVAAALAAMASRADARPLLPALRMPTRVIVGEHDAITPPDGARAMAASIPGAEVHVVAGAAHLAPMEQAATVSALML